MGAKRGEYPPVHMKISPFESISMVFCSLYLVIGSITYVWTFCVHMCPSCVDALGRTWTQNVHTYTIDFITKILCMLLILLVHVDVWTG
jgi:hypothetical protein